ncbi:MAG: hypothetical protein JXB13_11500 [Phycisphaerae bacterium]|nr:hypothetical protein [Phycisphaerae bacterium]
MPDEKLGPPVPVVLAMMICDAIHQDPATRKCTLLGTFSTINARHFPVVHPQLAVHIALTDGHGKVKIRLTLVGTNESNPPLFSGEGMIEFRDPRVVAELNFRLNNVTFPAAGEYRFQVYGNDQLLMERRLHVLEIQERKASDG